MSAQDMRDMLGLTGDVPRPAKKRKLVEKRPHEKGMAREVSALMGERAPPVSIIQVQPKYKQRPRRTQKVTPWALTPFQNEARGDGLELRHWQRKQFDRPEQENHAQSEPATEDVKESKVEAKPYQFAKYDIQIETPTYTDDIYEGILKDEDWSKEETDYLVGLVGDYGQKWPIVWDRYEFMPSREEGAESTLEPKTRSIEDLKARYYMVRAKMLAQDIPVPSMNGSQYALYQILTHFDARQEASRKKMTEQHLYRTEAEVQEETALLAELQRIMINQNQLEAARKEIRDRLDYPTSTNHSTQYTTSTALAQLFQQLVAADRSKKDRRLKDLPHVATHAGHLAGQRDSLSNAHRRPRDSIASAMSLDGPGTPHTAAARAAAAAQQQASAAAAAAASAAAAARTLTAHDRERFFVTMHERLGAGVSFASDKLAKPRVAKSTVQTERIAQVLGVLAVPDVIPLPTQAVVEGFERMMGKVGLLLEMRKVAEKEEGEIKVRSAEKALREGRSTGDVSGGVAGGEDAGDGGVGAVAAEEGGDDNAGGDAGAARGVKRSASVLSDASQAREKRRK